MTTTFPIVGAHFRPPAKAILQVLPAGAPLLLVREPDNMYDTNAIQVIVPTSSIPDDQADILDMLAKGYGFDIGLIMQEASWHVGYIPAARAVLLAPELDPVGCKWLVANLTFNAKGDTRAEWDEIVPTEGEAAATQEGLERHLYMLKQAKGEALPMPDALPYKPTVALRTTPLEGIEDEHTETIDELNPGSANGL